MAVGSLSVREERNGAVVVVRLLGQHDAFTQTGLSEQLEEAIERRRGVVVDLADATFMDSSTVHALDAAAAKAREAGVGFALRLGAGAIVRKTLEISGTLEQIPWSDSLEDAVELAAAVSGSR
jgi:anti-anti-sigma factor